MTHCPAWIRRGAPIVGVLVLFAPIARAQRLFASPEKAAAALREAAQARDTNAMLQIFGPDFHDLLTGNEAEDTRNYERFSRAASQRLEPVAQTHDRVFLEVGPHGWPFPIPLVRKGGEWAFDTAAGKDEILDRRIGRNELQAIGVCRNFVKSHGKMSLPILPTYGYLYRRISGPRAGTYLLAYPENWDRTGIMTFVVDPKGAVVRRDFGENTPGIDASMTRFEPGPDWQFEDEAGITFKK